MTNMASRMHWKVVRKKDRSSSLITNPKHKVYYPKGKIVTAPKDTLGIFIFSLKKKAEDWCYSVMSKWGDIIGEQIIIKVLPIGKPEKLPEHVLAVGSKSFNMEVPLNMFSTVVYTGSLRRRNNPLIFHSLKRYYLNKNAINNCEGTHEDWRNRGIILTDIPFATIVYRSVKIIS